MKLSQHVQRVQAALEAEKVASTKATATAQLESLRQDLERGDISDAAIAVSNAQERSATNVKELAEATSDARETDSDSIELADLESRANAALEGIKMVNTNGGFTLEQFQWAQRAVDAIFQPVGVNVVLQTIATESQEPATTLQIATENLEEVVAVVAATRENLSKGSVDAILKVLAVLEKAMPDVKDRLVGMQQSIRTIDFDEEAQIRLDDEVYKALSVDGKLPTGWKDYFASYLTFAQSVLSGYSDNALESANKACFLADALTSLSNGSDPINAVVKAIDEIGDPRKKIDTDKLLFVLPGSGPLFGNDVHDAHLNGGDDDSDVSSADVDDAVASAAAVAAPDAADGAIVGGGAAAAPAADDDGALGAPVEQDPNVTAALAAPTAVPVMTPAPAPAPIQSVANPEAAPPPAPAEPAVPEAAAPGAPAPPVAEPAAPAASGEAALAPAAEPEAAPVPAPEEELDENGNPKAAPAKESLEPTGGVQNQGMTQCDALITKLDKFSSDYVPLEPLSWDDRPEGSGDDTIRVLSKDSISGSVDSLIKAMECINIKSFGESNQQTWASARSAFSMYKRAFDNLNPQQMADIQPATESVGEYLDTVYNLSCWPVLHVLTNLVFTANAFLLLAERSISGQSADEAPAVDTDADVDGDIEVPNPDEQAAADGQADNDAIAGAGAADEGPAGDASVTSTT